MMDHPHADLDYIGILANVDRTIGKVDFGGGLTVDALSISDYRDLLGPVAMTSLLTADSYDNDESVFHVVKGRVASDLPYSKEDGSFFVPIGEFQRVCVNRIREFLEASMLLREGAPYLSKSIFLWTRNGQPLGRAIVDGVTESARLRGVPMDFDQEALGLLNDMTRTQLFPLKPIFLQFAFENLRLSYTVDDINLAFVSTITALESLLARGSTEARYKVSRNAAVLLGRSRDDCREIKKNMAEAYDLRSAIVHGSTDSNRKTTASDVDLSYARSIARRVIYTAWQMKKEKDDFFEYLTAKGYADNQPRM